VFLYEKYLGNSIARKGQALEAAQSSFEPSLIRELTRLGARLETAGTLLDQHTATTRLFAYLEDSTLASVQFRTFRFEILPDGNALLTMEGRARSFASVALQSDVFGKGNAIRSPVFDDLNVDPTGDVVFVMSATVDPQLVSYQGSAATDRPAPSEAVQEEIVTPTTTATTSGSGVPGTSTP
jgi:hypothetical protein